MRSLPFIALLAFCTSQSSFAQSTLSGRLMGPRHPGSEEKFPYTAVYVFANQPGADNEALAFRTWETEPVGWFGFGPANRFPYGARAIVWLTDARPLRSSRKSMLKSRFGSRWL